MLYSLLQLQNTKVQLAPGMTPEQSLAIQLAVDEVKGLHCPPMPKQLILQCSWGLPPPDPGGGFAARMKLRAPPPDPRAVSTFSTVCTFCLRPQVPVGLRPLIPLGPRPKPRRRSTRERYRAGSGAEPQRGSRAEPPVTFLRRSRPGVWGGAAAPLAPLWLRH